MLDEEGVQLCGAELAPLGESGGTAQLEIFAAAEMTLLIKMVVYGRMNRGEFLKTSHLPKSLHCPFSPPERLVRVFRPIVQQRPVSWDAVVPIVRSAAR